MRKKVFCNWQFWTDFKAKQPVLGELNGKNIQKMQNWLSFLTFISKSDLCFDLSQEEYRHYKESDYYLNSLWKKSTQGECGLEFCKDKFPEITENKIKDVNNDILNSIILVNEDNLCCQQLSANYGIMILNPEMALDCTHLFADNGIAVPNETEKDWAFLDKIAKKAPSISINNSVIIVDNYIFDNSDKSIDSNIIPILNSILPFQMEDGITCDVSVYTKANYGNVNLINELYDKIKRIRTELAFHINVINVAELKNKPDGSSYLYSKYFHDRAIITNHLWISSGHGFDIFPFRKEWDKPTTINVIYPHFQSTINWAEMSYNNLIGTAKKVNNSHHIYKNDYWGDEGINNRLLNNPVNTVAIKENAKHNVAEPEIFTIHAPKLPDIKIYGKIDVSGYSKQNRFSKHT